MSHTTRFGTHDSSTAHVFRNTALICLGVGGVSSLLFHVSVKTNQNNLDEPNCDTLNDQNELDLACGERPVSIANHVNDATTDDSLPQDSSVNHRHVMTIKDWLCEPQFYQIACTYMFTRLFVNLTQVFMPFYLETTLQLKAVYVAIIPLVMYLSGLANAFVINCVTKRLGKKLVYCIACIIGGGGCLWAHWGKFTIKNVRILNHFIILFLLYMFAHDMIRF